MQPQPDLISMGDLADSASQPLPELTAAPPLPPPAAKQAQQAQAQQQQQQQQQQGSPGIQVAAAAGGAGGGAQPAGAPRPAGAAGAGAAAAGALTGSLAYLQQRAAESLPTLGSSVGSALSSLRGRLGLPATTSGAALAAQQAAADAGGEQDEALLHLGERALAAAGSAAAPDARQLVAAARGFLATCSAEELRLGDLPALMADYRRLARLGWAVVLRWAAWGAAWEGRVGEAGGSGRPVLARTSWPRACGARLHTGRPHPPRSHSPPSLQGAGTGRAGRPRRRHARALPAPHSR